MSTWAADFADDLFEEPVTGTQTSARALEQLRVRARAAVAAVWAIDGGRLRLVRVSGESAVRLPDGTLEGADAGRTIERLRQAGTIVCRAGEVSDLESLVPDGMQSFIVASTTNRGVMRGALVVAWKEPVPPCDERAVGHIQIAAPLLLRWLTIADMHADLTRENVAHLARRAGELRVPPTADAVPLPMWVMSADGTLLYGNERWTQAIADTDEWRDWTIAFHPEDRAHAAAALDQAAGRREGFSIELRMKAGHGRYRWHMCLVNPQPTPHGGIATYVGCCCDVSARRRIETACNRIASRLVVAQEAERSRIARELHDDLGQRVALVASQLESALDKAPRVPRPVRSQIAAARDGLGDIAVTIHNLSHELHPAKIRLLGLVQTLEALCRDIVEETGADVRFSAEGMVSHVDEDTALCVFRVAQEALRNAVKHSRGRIFDVHLSGTATSLTLRIADDGNGFDPLAAHSAGIGLVTMRERVELMGGVLTVETALARGTMIEISVPVIHAPAGPVSARAASARAPVRARGRGTRPAPSDRDPE